MITNGIPSHSRPERRFWGGRCPGSRLGEIMVSEGMEAVQIPEMLVVR
jgi:hypothetical protein